MLDLEIYAYLIQLLKDHDSSYLRLLFSFLRHDFLVPPAMLTDLYHLATLHQDTLLLSTLETYSQQHGLPIDYHKRVVSAESMREFQRLMREE